jgi:oligopeptidase B
MVVGDKDYKEINWKDYIPHRSDALLEQFTVFKNHVVAVQRIEGISQVLVKTRDNSDADFYIDFGERAFVAYLMDNHQYEVAKVRVAYQSLTTPPTVMDVDFKTKNKTIWKEQEVKGGFNKTDYISERVFVTVRDGAKVPVSIVYHKNTKKDGKAPLLLYAYGSYGYSTDPAFSSVRLSLLNRGFIYAIAHIRGGEEMGRQWYENGKLLKKKNTFTDFVDVGEFLVREQYAAKDQLYAMGGSAGGLLMGAVINMRPDLWKGVIAAVPFVDVVTTMLDETIPLTTGEWDEWGNPKNKEYYDYMKSYSPYDNVAPVAYPNLLVTAGLHDSQVQYFEPAKWVAKMRVTAKGNNLLLLHTNMEAGHGGASGRFARHKETAMEYAFLLDLAGIKK